MQCLKPISIRNPEWLDGDSSQPRWLAVPCGKCSACLSRRRQFWAFRLNQEKLHSSSALFITLTYDNTMLPLDRDGIAHVSKRDCQTFLKRLRKYVRSLYPESDSDFVPRLRYYITAEYGPQTLRPHYHMLLFNFPLGLADPYSAILRCWNKGFVQVGPLLDGGGNYAAKYILHPLDENIDWSVLRKPFSLMSRKPGLGLGHLTPQMIKYYRENKTYLTKLPGGRTVPLPRYYRDKIFDKETLREISVDVVETAAQDREKQFWEDIRIYGESREFERRQDYDRKVKNSLSKQKQNAKL